MDKLVTPQQIVGNPTIRLAFAPAADAALATEPTAPVKKVEKGEKDVAKEKQVKRHDLIRVFLDCVPSLEDAKEDFQAVMESIQDPEVSAEVEGWLSQIEEIQVAVLEMTRGVIQEGRGAGASLPKPTESPITADMIAGKSPEPSVTVAAPKK